MWPRFMRKLIYGKPIIIVSGLPRSGTSMVMKMLAAAGVDIATDGLREADEDNPKGYFELEQVKELDKKSDKRWLKELRGKAVKIISFLLRELPSDNNYKVLFVERDLQEVIASQNKMLTNRQERGSEVSDEKMIKNYDNHLWKTKFMLRTDAQFEVLYLKHHDLITAPLEQSHKIQEFLGIAANPEQIAAVVDPELYRNRKGEQIK